MTTGSDITMDRFNIGQPCVLHEIATIIHGDTLSGTGQRSISSWYTRLESLTGDSECTGNS